MPLCAYCKSEAHWQSKPDGYEQSVKSHPNGCDGVCDRCGFDGRNKNA